MESTQSFRLEKVWLKEILSLILGGSSKVFFTSHTQRGKVTNTIPGNMYLAENCFSLPVENVDDVYGSQQVVMKIIMRIRCASDLSARTSFTLSHNVSCISGDNS